MDVPSELGSEERRGYNGANAGDNMNNDEQNMEDDDEEVHVSANGELEQLTQNRMDIKQSLAKSRYTTDKDIFSEYGDEDDDDVASERNSPVQHYGAANA